MNAENLNHLHAIYVTWPQWSIYLYNVCWTILITSSGLWCVSRIYEDVGDMPPPKGNLEQSSIQQDVAHP